MIKRFCEIFEDDTKNVERVSSNEYLEKGNIAIVDQGKKDIVGYTNTENYKICNEERIIFGDHTRIFKYINIPFITGADGTKVLKIKDNNNYEYKYFYYYLLHSYIPDTGYNRHFKWVKELQFNVVELKKQLEIVKKLDKVCSIIEERKVQIRELEQLVKSQFVEMFDGIENKVRLGDCCEVHARIGWQALTKSEHLENGDYMLITGIDFKDNEINYDTCVYVTKERYEMDKHIILRNNDILITKDGTIGKVAIVHNLNKPATLNSGVFVVRPDNRFNKEYIAYVFKGPLFEDFVDKSKTGATIKHLNQKHLVEFEIPLPSIELQNKFANLYQQIDKQKFVKQTITELSKLKEILIAKHIIISSKNKYKLKDKNKE